MYLKDIVEQVISGEIAGLYQLKKELDLPTLDHLVTTIASRTGKVIITGIGKSGIIAKKIVASLCSIGIGSVFLSAGDASHGDIGVIGENDLLMILSNSGYGHELKRIISYCKNLKISIIGLSQDKTSYLIMHSDIKIILPNIEEVSDLAIPTTSTTMMTVFGDVLTIALKEKIQLKSEQYSLYHPGGKIGLMYIQAKDIMLKGDALPIVRNTTPLITIMTTIAEKKLGFAIAVDENGLIAGIVIPKDNITTPNLITNTYKTISGDDSLSHVLLELKQYDQLIVMQDEKIEGVLTNEICNLIIR